MGKYVVLYADVNKCLSYPDIIYAISCQKGGDSS
jgi:hypothetical protein